MAICRVPKCDREVTNITRELCSRCNSSRYYWESKLRDNKNAAVDRIERLQFLTKRMHWFYQGKKK